MAFALLTHTQKDTSTSPATTTAIDTTGATLIVVSGGASQTNVGLTDSQGNRYYLASPPSTDATPHGHFMFVCFNPSTSASHTFSLSAGANFPSLCVACFSGSPGLVRNSTIATTAGATTITLPTITPATSGALLLTGICTGTTATASIDSGFTITDQGGGTTGDRTALAYLIQSPAAAVGPIWTLTGSTAFCGTMMAIELAAAGGGSAGGSYGFA